MAHSPRTLGVIPARLASTRLPRKMLRLIAGKPLLAWTYEAAVRSGCFDELLIAADSDEVLELCHRQGWPCIMTDPALPSGTDRLQAVAALRSADVYVNIQGDEPLLRAEHFHALLGAFQQGLAVEVTTLKVLCTPEEFSDPNAVKVVTAVDGRALYFSRAPVPFHRDRSTVPAAASYKHLGVYAYRAAALQRFAALPPSALELTEKLEQLRLLENGIALYVAETPYESIGVDTEADLQRVEALLLARG